MAPSVKVGHDRQAAPDPLAYLIHCARAAGPAGGAPAINRRRQPPVPPRCRRDDRDSGRAGPPIL